MMKPNMRVLAGLGVVAVGVLLFFPSTFGWLLPLLLIAACPLAMIFMMRGMGSTSGRGDDPTRAVTDDPAREQVPSSDVEAIRLRAELDQLQAEKAALEADNEPSSPVAGSQEDRW